jgi:hypothetical protein
MKSDFPLGEFLFFLAQNKDTCFIVCILYKARFYGLLKFRRHFSIRDRQGGRHTTLYISQCFSLTERKRSRHERQRKRARKEIKAKVRLLCKAFRFLVRQLFWNESCSNQEEIYWETRIHNQNTVLRVIWHQIAIIPTTTLDESQLHFKCWTYSSLIWTEYRTMFVHWTEYHGQRL